MKSVLISIQRPHTDNIKALIKKIEIRKNKPNQETPFPCFIYETKTKGGCGKVIGEFVCDKVEVFSVGSLRCDDIEKLACLSYTEMINYFYKPEELDGKTAKFGYAWHISDLKIYDKPKPIMQFYKPCPIEIKNCPGCEFYSPDTGCCMNNIDRPPQSWCYVEEI